MVICHPPEFEILISTFTYAGHKQNYPPGIWKVEVFTNGYNNNIIKLYAYMLSMELYFVTIGKSF
jgi:hypothetical protein